MSKNRREIALLLAAGSAFPAFAQFGSLGGLAGGGKSSGGGNFDANLKTFSERCFKLETLGLNSCLAAVAAFAADSEKAKYQELFKEVGKQTNLNECGAVYQKCYESTEGELKKLAVANNLTEQAKKLSDEKAKTLVNAVFNYSFGVLILFKAIPNDFQNLASSASIMDAAKLPTVKDSIQRLVNGVKVGAPAIIQISQALLGANIKVKESSGNFKEETIESIG